MTISSTDSSHSRSSSQLPDDDQTALDHKKEVKPEQPVSDRSSGAQLVSRQKSIDLSKHDDTWPTADDLPPEEAHTPGILKSRSSNPSEQAPSTTTLTATITTTTTTNTSATTVTTTVNPLNTAPNPLQHSYSSSVKSTTRNERQVGVTQWGISLEAHVAEAVKKEDIMQLQTLLDEHPALLNTVLREFNQTPLAFAIQSGNKKMIGYLLTCEHIDINHPGTDGTTALHTAAAKGDLASLSLLLAAGADPDTVDHQRSTPLISAAAYGHADVVQALLARLKKSVQLNRQDQRGCTALTYAAVAGDAIIARLLLNHGADPRLASRENKPPLIYAIERGHPEVVLALVEYGVNPRKKTASGATPLTCAVTEGHVELTKKLLSLGITFPSDWADPVAIAADSGHAAIVALLHQHRYPIDDASAFGKTPLMKASNQGDTETVNLLISLGADMDKADNDGSTALDIAVATFSNKSLREDSHIEVIATLLAHMKGPIKIREKTRKPLMTLAIERVYAHQDWGVLREIMAKGLVNPTGEALTIDLQGLKQPSASQENSSAQ
jgi:ankyrin repeat protein